MCVYVCVHPVEEWQDTNMTFLPMVWSREGRAHPQTLQAIKNACKLIAHKYGTSVKGVERRWHRELGKVLASRRARMAMRCLPKPDERSYFAVFGDAKEGGDNQEEFDENWDEDQKLEEAAWGAVPMNVAAAGA